MSQNGLTPDPSYLVVRGAAMELAAGRSFDRAQAWHQFVLVRSGALMAQTGGGSWVVPAGWALWIPGGMEHRVRALRNAAVAIVYAAPDAFPDLPDRCTARTASPLLAALTERVAALGALDSRVKLDAAMAVVLLDAIRTAPVPPFGLPEPRSEATRAAIERLFSGEGDTGTAALAQAAGVGIRTLERRFLAETGMSLGRWRRRGGMLAAIERLAAGASVREAAEAAGYAAPSAFVAAFRAEFGETPGRYLGER